MGLLSRAAQYLRSRPEKAARASEEARANRSYWLNNASATATDQRHTGNRDWLSSPKAAPFIAEVTSHLRAGMSLAELGCSSGYWFDILALADRQIFYTGYDINPQNIATAQSRYPSGRFIVSDISDVGGLGNYDYILCRQVLFFLDHDDVSRIFSQARLLTLQEPFRPGLDETRVAFQETGAVTHMHPYGRIARDCGLTVTHEEVLSVPAANGDVQKLKLLMTLRR